MDDSDIAITVSKTDEFCIQNEECCIQNEELCIKNDEFCSSPARDAWLFRARSRRSSASQVSFYYSDLSIARHVYQSYAEIICVTDPVATAPAFTCATGAGVADCATCTAPLTLEGECATCNAGAELSGGTCCETSSATITISSDDAGVSTVGMVSMPADGGSTFLSDEGLGKGGRWAVSRNHEFW